MPLSFAAGLCSDFGHASQPTFKSPWKVSLPSSLQHVFYLSSQMPESRHCPQPIRPSSVAGCSSLVCGLQMSACRAISKQRSEAVRQVAAAPRLLLLLGLLGALTHRRCTLQDD